MLERLKSKRAMLDAQIEHNNTKVAELQEMNIKLAAKREIVNEMIEEEQTPVVKAETSSITYPSSMRVVR